MTRNRSQKVVKERRVACYVLSMFVLQPLFRIGVALCMQQRPSSGTPSLVPRIDSVRQVASTRWLALQTLSYTDQDGKTREWDSVARTTKQSSDKADAVVIVPLLRKKGSKEIDTLLVEQFRPPIGQVVVSFPAGLIDEGENPQDAALRELREETGYVGEGCKVMPWVSREVCMCPGMSSSSSHCVLVEVDLDNPYNHGTPKTELDEGEFITLKRVDLKVGLKRVLDDGDCMPHVGLYLFAMGLDLGMNALNDASF